MFVKWLDSKARDKGACRCRLYKKPPHRRQAAGRQHAQIIPEWQFEPREKQIGLPA
jgi:hypothetical protein